MSFLSFSRSKGYRPKHNRGSSYYKRSGFKSGILGFIYKMLFGHKHSRSSFSSHHKRKSLWRHKSWS